MERMSGRSFQVKLLCTSSRVLVGRVGGKQRTPRNNRNLHLHTMCFCLQNDPESLSSQLADLLAVLGT